MLSNQRSWKQISEKHTEIKEIFNNFNYEYLLNAEPLLLVDKIREIKCGNRSIKSQMYGLRHNLLVFASIISDYGSLDSYVTSEKPEIIAHDISEGKYKLKGIGLALAMEYLKNVGIDTIKPDTHIKRLFGSDRLGLSNKEFASDDEVIKIVHQMSSETGLSSSEIDSIIWQFCATKYAFICGGNPKCEKCLLRTRCNKPKIKN